MNPEDPNSKCKVWWILLMNVNVTNNMVHVYQFSITKFVFFWHEITYQVINCTLFLNFDGSTIDHVTCEEPMQNTEIWCTNIFSLRS